MTTDSTPRAAKPPADTSSAPGTARSAQNGWPAARQPIGARLAALAAAGLRDPLAVGTFAPSSRALADRLASVVPAPAQHPAPVVVELGAGTGEITPAIMRRVGPQARVFAVESDTKLAAILERRRLGVEVLAADARLLPQLLGERNVEQADAVVSAIPFTLMPVEGQRTMLRAVHACVRPDGVFTTIAYAVGLQLPGAVRFRRELDAVFHEVLATRTVWRNFLPAMSYVCRYPKALTAD